MKRGIVVPLIAVFAVIQFVIHPGYAVTCGQVDASLLLCVPYLTGHGGDSPSPACCNGVKAVKEMAQTVEEKRECCSCVKAAANRYADLKDAAAQSLPKKCDVDFDIPISRSVDCDKLSDEVAMNAMTA